MGPLFGKHAHKEDPVKAKQRPVEKTKLSSKDQAVLKLKVTRDKVEKLKKRNEKEAQQYVLKAKQCLKEGKKPQAKLALRWVSIGIIACCFCKDTTNTWAV